MEEIVYYNSEGHGDDKNAAQVNAFATSIHTQSHNYAFRQSSSYPHGSVITGTSAGDRVFVASRGKALINVYTWGKESPDQRIPIPEQLTSLTLCPNSPNVYNEEYDVENDSNFPKFRLPYLLVGGGLSGKIYVWELNSGLLLCVKEAHYQSVNVLKTTSDGSYLVSGGKDARVLIWKIIDLISFVKDDDKVIKPVQIISDNTLEITDIFINNSIHQDSKIYTVSRDSTIRVYETTNFQLISTFIVGQQVESIVVDSADRAIYLGLNNGNIRQINIYEPNPATNVLEAKGGYGKVITLSEDHQLTNTLTHHSPNPVTSLGLSLDGSLLVSGDSSGKITISDVLSKQIVKELKELNSKITNIEVFSTHKNALNQTIDKTSKAIPPFKRVISNKNPKEQDVVFQVGEDQEEQLFNIEEHLNRVSKESLYFQNLNGVNSEVVFANDQQSNNGSNSNDGELVQELQEKVTKLTKAYTDIRKLYEDLYSEHTNQ
ncbi:Pre-rRNA-processing protein [Wickerhamomyces ciferrii]|uniref:Pre-rRNA-processing protein IPI3 n=1 Tax=Wickerhamomyces ciferrii (strain ATCC 14091 / BCRC 22168 / CBS 111 / JCM 3599 / NBRC 0793 / NRRL Y-1031 F-60-10) TaxID=1206466 RepID=K0KTN1_WICCF|nr:Pre-rRNA-processing protein [Wickerhamomyces ciferrii]CCH44739.1 Pre-rRNA-processing protein [Wickerhamomyces ciferrii]